MKIYDIGAFHLDLRSPSSIPVLRTWHNMTRIQRESRENLDKPYKSSEALIELHPAKGVPMRISSGWELGHFKVSWHKSAQLLSILYFQLGN